MVFGGVFGILQHGTVGIHNGSVPVGAVLQNAFSGGEIHKDQTKAFAVAAVPLVVVRQGPVEVAPDLRAALAAAPETQKIAVQEVNAVGVVDLTVQTDNVVAAQAVFRDVDGCMVPLP